MYKCHYGKYFCLEDSGEGTQAKNQSGFTSEYISSSARASFGSVCIPDSSLTEFAKCTNEFIFGRASLDYDLHRGWLKSTTTPEFITKVHKMATEDRRLNVQEITEAVEMSSEQVYPHFNRKRYTKKGQVWQGKKVIFHHDNTHPHTSVIDMAKNNELR